MLELQSRAAYDFTILRFYKTARPIVKQSVKMATKSPMVAAELRAR